MGRFVCEPCRSDYQLTVTDVIVTACCELCGVLRGDWGWKRVALTAARTFSHLLAGRRAKLLQRIAEFDADLRQIPR